MIKHITILSEYFKLGHVYSDEKEFVSLYLLHLGLFPLHDDMKEIVLVS